MAGDGGFTPAEQQERHIAALRRERAGYLAAGKTARVEAVDAELERLGASGEGETKEARKQAPQGRSQAQKQTTD
jgi:hypothetical protein